LISLLVMLPALAGCIGDDDVSTTKIDDGGISAGAVDFQYRRNICLPLRHSFIDDCYYHG